MTNLSQVGVCLKCGSYCKNDKCETCRRYLTDVIDNGTNTEKDFNFPDLSRLNLQNDWNSHNGIAWCAFYLRGKNNHIRVVTDKTRGVYAKWNGFERQIGRFQPYSEFIQELDADITRMIRNTNNVSHFDIEWYSPAYQG